MEAKKIITGIAVAALILSPCTVSFSASETAKSKSISNPDQKSVCSFCGKTCSFTDKNGDGVCDFYAARNGSKANPGQNFVDDNGDGICDNYKKNKCGYSKQKRGNGSGKQGRSGKNCGKQGRGGKNCGRQGRGGR